jgi:hypothetical protein
MNLETFSEIMNDFITENECQMLITLPEGTQDAVIKTNLNLGPVGEIYMMLQAIHSSCGELFKMVNAGNDEIKAMSASICELVYKSLTEDE